MTSPRMLLLRHFEVDPNVNGFTTRYDVVTRAARSLAMVEQATIGPVGSGATIEVDGVVFSTSRIGRVRRLQAACGLGGPFARATKVLDKFVATKKVSVVLGCTYRTPELYGRVARRVATYVFIEERARAFGYGEPASPTIRSRVLATMERSGLRHLLGPVRGLAVIQSGEIAAAERRWKRPVSVIPHAIVEAEVAGEPEAALSVEVLTVGNFAERRNADGLRKCLSALRQMTGSTSLSLAAISATAFAGELDEFLQGAVECRVGVSHLGPSYASARVVLVPSFATSGSKTTILQGWAARRPVVTTQAAATSVGAVHGVDVLIGGSGEELVALCFALLSDAEMAERIVAGGANSLGLRHSERAVTTALKSMLGSDWEKK